MFNRIPVDILSDIKLLSKKQLNEELLKGRGALEAYTTVINEYNLSERTLKNIKEDILYAKEVINFIELQLNLVEENLHTLTLKGE